MPENSNATGRPANDLRPSRSVTRRQLQKFGSNREADTERAAVESVRHRHYLLKS
jgi:hypothetical protein